MASFVDRAPIRLRAGNGGNGCMSFHREKFVQNGGPDGGDGGKGGDIVLVADHNLHTLLDFRFHTKFEAENGEDGMAARCAGKNGQDLVVKLPVGTVVRDKETGKVVCDMFENGQRRILLHGGRGGWGNSHFATPTRQAPNFAKPGIKTVWHEFLLELKTIADVGLVGYPNAGKSSLLAKVTRAQPKIGSYPFTTLTPNLGIVDRHGKSFAIADIPGLIENASEGAGLGTAFLRHVERTRLLLHVVDTSGQEGRDPAQDYLTIQNELKRYGGLDELPQLVVANKMDLPDSAGHLDALRKAAQGNEIFPISAATGEGLGPLLDRALQILESLPPPAPLAEEAFLEEAAVRGFTVEQVNGVYRVAGSSISHLVDSVNFEDTDSVKWFHRTLRQSGIIDKLRAMGCKEGDTVEVEGLEFEFID